MFGVAKPEWEKSPALVVNMSLHYQKNIDVQLLLWLGTKLRKLSYVPTHSKQLLKIFLYSNVSII